MNLIKECVKIKISVTEILEFNQYQKSDKAQLMIDLECLIEKIDGYKNNPENSSRAKVGEHIPSGFSMSTISSFKNIENKRNVYKGKDCVKKFCDSLTEHKTKVINSKKRKMKLLTKERQESHENAKILLYL